MNLSRCCQGSVDGKSTSMGREAVKNLSARQKISRWIEKLSRQIPESSMDRNCANFCRERKSKGLDRQEAVELEENEFFKEWKNT